MGEPKNDKEYQKIWEEMGSPLDFTVEDMKWIDENVKEDPLLLFFWVPESWIKRAKEVTAERQRTIKTHFVDDGNWCGILGEYFTGKSFGFLKDNNAGDWKARHDFTHKNGKKIDVKTRTGRKDYNRSFQATVYQAQIDFKKYDAIIFGYLKHDGKSVFPEMINGRPCYPFWIFGWIPTSIFEEKCKAHKNGEVLYTSRGTKRFTVKAPVYDLESGFIEDLRLLEDYKYTKTGSKHPIDNGV